MTTLSDLIARLEAAKEGEEGRHICEALQVAFAKGWINTGAWKRGTQWAMAGATLDAGLILLPDDGWWVMKAPHHGISRVKIYLKSQIDAITGSAPAPASAFTIAALKAREAGR